MPPRPVLPPALLPGVAGPLPGLQVNTGYQQFPRGVQAVWHSGFENQVAAYVVDGLGLCDAVGGTIGSATDQAHSGAASLKTLAASSYIQLALPTFQATSVYRGYHRFISIPGANMIIATCLVGLQNCDIILTSGGVLQAQVETGTAVNGPTVVANQWYCIEAFFDYRSNPTRISWRVDGVEQSQATLAQAPLTFQNFRIGCMGAGSVTTWIDDAIISQTASDYPIGPGYSKLFAVTGKGTHVPAAGAFQDDTTAAITDAGDSATQSWLRLDEEPPSLTDYVTQTVSAPTGYLEYSLADSAEGNTPNSVAVYSAIAAASAASCDMSVKANDNGAISAGKTITTALTTPSYSREVLATRPLDGQQWSETDFNSLLLRAGYATDVTPNPRLAAVWVEVDYAGVAPTVTPPRPLVVSAAVSNAAVM